MKCWVIRDNDLYLYDNDVLGDGGRLFSEGAEPFPTRRDARLFIQSVDTSWPLVIKTCEWVEVALVNTALVYGGSRRIDWSMMAWPPKPFRLTNPEPAT